MASGQITVWSGKHRWIERAQAYDRDMSQQEQAAKDNARAKALQRWETRLVDQWEQRWSLGEALLYKSAEILGKPLEQATEMRPVYDSQGRAILDPNGQPLQVPVVVEPIGYRLADAASLAKAALLLHQSVAVEVRHRQEPQMTSHDSGVEGVELTARDRAVAELEAWRAAQRQALAEGAPSAFGVSGSLLALPPPPDDDED